ncbi:MAG: hypothetical protein ACLPT4_13580 [Verrucomicrobiia bacterium]
MRTNAEFTQLGRKLEGKRVVLICGAVVAAMMLATPAPASTNAVADAMWDSVNQLTQAGIDVGGADAADAVSAVNAAVSDLNQAQAALASSGLSLNPVTFTKQIDAAIKKLDGLGIYLESPKLIDKTAVSKLASAAKSLQKLANLSGRPLLEEVTPNNSAGFLKAGSVVTMAFAIPEGCTTWTVSCTGASGVIASYTPDYTTGTIQIIMGSTQGGADVHIYGCNCGTNIECCSRLLYNYGGKTKTVAGLPEGFPTDLTTGDYGLTYSVSVSCSDGSSYSDGPYSVGSFPLSGNLKSFYDTFKSALDAAVASVSEPGCSQNVAYSAFNGDSFTCTYTVSCTSCGGGTCATCTSTMVFTFTKL